MSKASRARAAAVAARAVAKAPAPTVARAAQTRPVIQAGRANVQGRSSIQASRSNGILDSASGVFKSVADASQKKLSAFASAIESFKAQKSSALSSRPRFSIGASPRAGARQLFQQYTNKKKGSAY